MSNIGKEKLNIPEGVNISLEVSSTVPGYVVKVCGPLGIQTTICPKDVLIKLDNNELSIVSPDKSMWGTGRKKLEQMIIGTSTGYTRSMKLHGVGYKAELTNDNSIVLSVGKSHPVKINIPENIKLQCPNPTTIIGWSTSLDELTNYLNNIRLVRPASKDPYRGKGIL